MANHSIEHDNNQIFRLFHPKENDQLSQLSGYDLQDFIILLNDYYLTLRKQIGLKQTDTFGLELEFENAKRDKIESLLEKDSSLNDWIIKNDSSLCYGAEINSPILRDTKANWDNLNKVCDIVEPLASIEKKAGGHIHIGTQTIGDNVYSWIHFIKLWSVYENVLFRFFYGDHLTARSCINEYAEPLADKFWDDYNQMLVESPSLPILIYHVTHTRHQAVNFKRVNRHNCGEFWKNNTIEFRCPNGTLNPTVWQNNVNTLVKLLHYVKSSDFNDDIVEKRHSINQDEFNQLELYDEIFLDQALELSDMIFHNNLDKIYFLKQYLKSFEVNDRSEEYPKGKVFTKKKKW
jgi:hypothetical protein